LKAACALALTLPVFAHVVSMSTGETRLNGARLDYEIRMPLYEVAHIRDPESELFANIGFAGAGGEARLLEHRCRAEGNNFVCTGLYLFERDVDEFTVRCTFAAITVPNHVHLLRAVHGAKTDQAVFDASFTEAAIRFRPPTALEAALRAAAAGFWRAAAALAEWLFLAALVLAARSKRELAALAAAFFAGQSLTLAAGLASRLQLSPRFIEAAAALTIAYLAVEILVLPAARSRRLVVAILGILHGTYFEMLIAAGGYRPLPYFGGVLLAGTAVLLLLAFAGRLAARVTAPRALVFERAMASALFLTGLAWFGLRLRS
jgi:hypothetical protein